MAKKGSSASKKASYQAYKTLNVLAKNKLTKLARHLKRHPNDKQSQERKIPEWPKKSEYFTKTQYSRQYLNKLHKRGILNDD